MSSTVAVAGVVIRIAPPLDKRGKPTRIVPAKNLEYFHNAIRNIDGVRDLREAPDLPGWLVTAVVFPGFSQEECVDRIMRVWQMYSAPA